MASNPNSEITDLIRVIITEPVLKRYILSICNSESLKLNKRVTNISRAIMMMGFHGINRILIALEDMEQGEQQVHNNHGGHYSVH